MADSHDLQPGYVIAEKYRVERQLGEGGMGQVYLVQHIKTDERFALKILNPEVAKTPSARERFRREARTPARIDSDHVARVVDSDIAEDLDEAPFLVMEYLRGKNLQELSEDLGPLPADEVLVYMRQMAIALDKAHAIGIVHRDLKPENLFLTTRDDGTPCVKILDFGIAKLSGATGDLARIKATATGDIFGTPMYMSPEQCKSEADKISARSDIWALGLIAYRLLSGDDFWTANTLTHLIAQIAYEPIPKPSVRAANLGPGFDGWFACCCHRQVDQRFASASEAVNAFAAAMGLGGQVSGPGAVAMRAAAHLQSGAVSSPEAAMAPTLASDELSSSGPLVKTSEALTLDKIEDEARPSSSRRPLLIGGLAALALAAGGVALVVFGGDAATSSGQPSGAGASTVAAAPTPQETALPEPTVAPTTEPTASPMASASASVPASASASVPLVVEPPPPPAVRPMPPPPPVVKPPPPPPPPPPPKPEPTNPLDRRH